jgi:hypothetical protein
MQIFYRVLWSLALLLIIAIIIIFSLGFLAIGAAVMGLLGIYNYYFRKKIARGFKTSRPYRAGEVIDLHADVVHETIEIKKLKK